MNIEKLDTKNLTEKDWEELHDFTAELFAEIYPHETNITLDYVKRIFTETNKGYIDKQYVIKDDGKIIAKGKIFYLEPNSYTKESDIDNATIDIRVRSRYRRKKIATSLLSYLVKNDLRERHTRFFLSTNRSPGYKFCESFSGEKTVETFSSNLNFDAIDWKNIEGINAKSAEKSKEISVDISEGVSNNDWPGYVKLHCELLEEISKYRGDHEFNKELIQKRLAEMMEDKKTVSFLTWAKDKKGNLLGFSELFYKNDKPEKLITLMTGVSKDFRGMGLCMRMKTDLLLYAKENIPEAKYVWTANDKDNAVMRGINHKLGFIPENPYRAYVYQTADMKKKLGIS